MARLPKRRRSPKRQGKRGQGRFVLLAALAMTLGIGGVIYWAGRSPSAKPVTPQHTFVIEPHVQGSRTASVTVVVWEDFQCVECKAANSSVLAQVQKDYVATGKAKLQYRHFATLGEESFNAAEGSECADERSKFWEYHDALFVAQGAENTGAFSNAKLKGIAAKVGLNAGSFSSCLDSHRYREAVAQDRRDGEKLGIKKAPAFFVNGAAVTNWQSYPELAGTIDKALGTPPQ